MAPPKIYGQELEVDGCTAERGNGYFPPALLSAEPMTSMILKILISAAQSSHFLAVAQAKLLLIQEESAWARTLQSPKYFAGSKYKNYSPTTEQHQPLGGMQELFNSVQKRFPTGLDRSWRFVYAQLKLWEKAISNKMGPLPCLHTGRARMGEHHLPKYHTTSSRILGDFSGAHPSDPVLHMRSGKIIAPSVWVSTVKCFK